MSLLHHGDLNCPKLMHLPGNATDAQISQLKRGGMVKSKRSFKGGYMLIRPPDKRAVGDIIA